MLIDPDIKIIGTINRLRSNKDLLGIIWLNLFPGPLGLDEMRQVNYGRDLISDDPIPQFSYFLTYPNLPIDIIFYGIESGFKRLQPEYELSFSFSYFNDQNLRDKREKAERYAEELNLNEGNGTQMIKKFQKYYPYLKNSL